MKIAYQGVIDIMIHDVYLIYQDQMLDCVSEFHEAREEYPEESEERAILDRLFDRAKLAIHSGKGGYLGSSVNCAFSVLYEVFGVDVIAFLFDQPWVPSTAVDPFRPKQFLARLTILETASGKLAEGDTLPILLPQTASYRRPRTVPLPSSFLGGNQGLLLRQAFRELRDFGELGVRMQRTGRKLTVDINFIPGVADDEVLAFAAQPA